MDKTALITIVSILLVLVVTGMIAFLMTGAKAKEKKRMMNVIRGAQADEAGAASGTADMRREALAKKLKEGGDPEKEEERKKSLATSLMQAGLSISVKQFWLYSALLCVVCTGAVFLMGKGPFLIIMTAIISFMGIPKLIVRHLKKRRQKKFLAELADVLDAMTRLLRAGMPVSEAIKMVAREFDGPIGEEMGRIFDQQKIGVSLSEAVLDCAFRMPLPEVQMFSTAVSIQAQTGSSLSEILEGLAKVIRARFRLRRKVQALSSEAKWSAIIIGALPLFVSGGMYALNPDYIGLLFHEPRGHMLLGIAGCWMLCGILVMRQMINFKI